MITGGWSKDVELINFKKRTSWRIDYNETETNLFFQFIIIPDVTKIAGMTHPITE